MELVDNDGGTQGSGGGWQFPATGTAAGGGYSPDSTAGPASGGGGTQSAGGSKGSGIKRQLINIFFQTYAGGNALSS